MSRKTDGRVYIPIGDGASYCHTSYDALVEFSGHQQNLVKGKLRFGKKPKSRVTSFRGFQRKQSDRNSWKHENLLQRRNLKNL